MRRQHREATAAGIGPGTTAMHMQRTASGVAGNGLYTTINYMRGAAGLGLGTTIKYLRRTTSAAANKSLSTKINPPCSVAVFVVNLEPHTGERPSVRLCVGPELARCVHKQTVSYGVFYFEKKLSCIEPGAKHQVITSLRPSQRPPLGPLPRRASSCASTARRSASASRAAAAHCPPPGCPTPLARSPNRV